jgi:serine/threonine protein kinase
MELVMLSTLNKKNHQNLVKLLATYKYKHKYHLLFPFAKANLRALWKTFVPMPQWDRDTFLWVISQLSGLVSALHLVHEFPTGNYPLGSDTTSKEASRSRPSLPTSLKVAKNEEKYGRHGDIKPENILWDCESEGSALAGTLILADFGLGRFHRLESRSRQDPAQINGSHTYAPPEITLGRPVSRAYDIWSLGCVFLEFITWLLEGSVGLDEFLKRRSAMAHDGVDDDTYYTIIGTETARDAEVRRGVVSWMEYLRTSQGCSRMVKDLLDSVRLDMLRVNSKERISAENLDARLKHMVNVSETNDSYLLG